MAQKYVGFKKWTAKSGKIGYSVYLVEPVSGDGAGVCPVQVYSFGKMSAPSVSPETFGRFFANLKLDTFVELRFDRFGGIIGLDVVK